MRRRWLNRIRRRLRGRPLPVWASPAYRPPLAATSHTSGFEPRRADLALWYLLDAGVISSRGNRQDDGRDKGRRAAEGNLRAPPLASWAELARVHTAELLDSLTQGDTLARVFTVTPAEMPIDAMLETLRLACGGTIAAARHAVAHGGPTLNLLGGFHHAGPAKAGAMCALNDVAVAVAAVRAEGFAGQIAVLDLDAHPPDGIARCLCDDDHVWIGSISGADWGELGCVRERLLPENTGDEPYLQALDELLREMPEAPLTFVLAGGDVLATDPLGALGLSEAGVAERDRRIAEALAERGSVWLPAGGYTSGAWRILAGTATVLSLGEVQSIPPEADPLATNFARVAQHLEHLDGDDDVLFTEADLVGGLGLPGPDSEPRLLGYYTASGIELALSRFGLLDHIRRLGYRDLRVELHGDPAGDVLRLLGHVDWGRGTADRDAAAGPALNATAEQALVEASLSRLVHHLPAAAAAMDERTTARSQARAREAGDQEAADHDAGTASIDLLYVNWLTLRHPRATFSATRPALPGQEVPGLGLARETTVLLARMAKRLHMAGVAFRPASYHVAYSARHQCSFADPERQGLFRALRAAVAGLPLLTATRLVDQGKVLLNGEVYRWQPDLMVHWLEPQVRLDQAEIKRAEAAAHFTLAPDVISSGTADGVAHLQAGSVES